MPATRRRAGAAAAPAPSRRAAPTVSPSPSATSRLTTPGAGAERESAPPRGPQPVGDVAADHRRSGRGDQISEAAGGIPSGRHQTHFPDAGKRLRVDAERPAEDEGPAAGPPSATNEGAAP